MHRHWIACFSSCGLMNHLRDEQRRRHTASQQPGNVLTGKSRLLIPGPPNNRHPAGHRAIGTAPVSRPVFACGTVGNVGQGFVRCGNQKGQPRSQGRPCWSISPEFHFAAPSLPTKEAATDLHLAEATDRHPLQPTSHRNPEKAKPELIGLAIFGYQVYSLGIGIMSSHVDWNCRGFPFRGHLGIALN
jgi:hypothetical protein